MVNSLLCQGSIVSGGRVVTSILSPDVFVDFSAEVSESILFPGVTVGTGAKLRRCVIDKNVTVPPGYQIGFDPVADRERFTISDRGVVIVDKDRVLD